MKLDTMLRDVAFPAIAQQAQRFERMGFDGVWTFESAHDPFLPLALAATATTCLHIGTNIAVAFGRSPFAMAQVAWDLQKESGGRLHLGLGTQVRAHIERRFSMPFDHPAARVTDYIRCLRAIWETFQNDTRPNYTGPFYRFTLINPFFNPGPIAHPHIPVYLAGVNPRMCRAAGEVADGFHVHPMHSVGYLKAVVLPALDEGARLSGRTVDDLVLYAPVFTVSGHTQAEVDAATQQVRQQIAFYASTPSYRVLLEYHGYAGLGRQLSALMRQGDLAAMARLVPDALLEAVAVVASPAELPGKLRQRYAGILQRVALYFPLAADAAEGEWQRFTAAFRSAAG
jgi:probable F420-dependent oxidoreductase